MNGNERTARGGRHEAAGKVFRRPAVIVAALDAHFNLPSDERLGEGGALTAAQRLQFVRPDNPYRARKSSLHRRRRCAGTLRIGKDVEEGEEGNVRCVRRGRKGKVEGIGEKPQCRRVIRIRFAGETGDDIGAKGETRSEDVNGPGTECRNVFNRVWTVHPFQDAI